MKSATVIFAALLSVAAPALGGEGKITPVKAAEYYQLGNFDDALEYYSYLVKSDERNIQYNLRLGVCYLNTYINKSLAIPYFRTVIDLDALDQVVNFAIAYYLLGRAYHYDGQYDLAIQNFEKYLSQENITEEDAELARQKIQFCFNAKELVKFPVIVTFENLGKDINSKYAEYYPHVPADESFLVYNSKRSEGAEKMSDGSYASNVYIAEVESGHFGKAKPIGGSLNTKQYNEAIIGMSASGSNGIFYIEDEDDLIDLYTAKINDGNVSKIEMLNARYNTNDLEIAASVSADGETLYIASKRKGGFGGSDIYMAKKLPTGAWGDPMNLGPEINTPYDDVFPNISPDEKTLYFSSEGHTSMGGLDIFRAEWDEVNSRWSSIKNIGYPINTAGDDMNFRISETGKFGYISTFRQGGYGHLDIYRVNFNEVEPRYTVIAGKLYAVNTNQIFRDVQIEVNSDDASFYGTYNLNPTSGRYVMILPPGKYIISVAAEGYIEVSEDIEILDKSHYRTFIGQDLVLKPKDILGKLPAMEDKEEAETTLLDD